MEIFKIENLTFSYPGKQTAALKNINLSVSEGEFITIFGKSGCGKTTLLKLLKPELSPIGNSDGDIFFHNSPVNTLSLREQAAKIGFVMQNPDNQIVTDKVWHELAFGLESLGLSTCDIRAKVAEMASFFGIEKLFHNNTDELSGGQKQLLNLASVMVMQPSVLILDEPTSQLDPIAAHEFLKTIEKINHELGTTIIITEHRLEDTIPLSNRVIFMDNGEIIADTEPRLIGNILRSLSYDLYSALPAPIRICAALKNDTSSPLTVSDGRKFLESFAKNNTIHPELIPSYENKANNTIIELNDVWFKYEKELPDIIKGLTLKIYEGEILSILGGNGAGKTTLLSLISGLLTPYRGNILINSREHHEYSNLYNGVLGILPQNPQSLFTGNTVFKDLSDMLEESSAPISEKEAEIKSISELCCIDDLLDCHPYDLSGGEQQRVALAKILLNNPSILLLDEPTKGMDSHFKQIFANILIKLKKSGATIIMISHDIEFCAEYSDRSALFFDGDIVSIAHPRKFFSEKNFYTTSANRMARTILPAAVLADDVILACGGNIEKKKYDLSYEFKIQAPKIQPRKKRFCFL